MMNGEVKEAGKEAVT